MFDQGRSGCSRTSTSMYDQGRRGCLRTSWMFANIHDVREHPRQIKEEKMKYEGNLCPNCLPYAPW
jgi:hypothetical protein